MQLTKWTLIIIGVLVLVMGIAGLPSVSDMKTEPDWYAVLKIYRHSSYCCSIF